MTKYDQDMAKWVKTWKHATPALQEIRKKEISTFDYSQNYQLIDEMLQYACDQGEERTTTGLIEQQRLFKKLAKNEERIK